ncbi:MAG: methyltransferase domain-containing protein [Cyanobacteria bacterium P01_D01_bin.115]
MNRKAKILRHIDRSGRGIEIGPSHNPVAPKKDGYQVHIIDHMSREQLIEKYQAHGLDLSQIEAVDFVWQGESYAELTGKTDYYDWIIASHVIEHAPDLISFINSCDEVLKADGVLSLVIPDKRYCFDHYRPITGLAKIIDNHLQKSINHTPGTIAEYFLNVVSQSGQIAWNAETTFKKYSAIVPGVWLIDLCKWLSIILAKPVMGR